MENNLMDEILYKIVEKRKQTILQKGINFGINIPDKRIVSLTIPDFNNGVIITEIKRGSPSEGKMNNIDSPTEWAKSYIDGGTNVISILTEEDFFFGSLRDLI
jgi:indole-3-glycerol phosphate synthase/phosphoribosylanthranilate isomerase